MSLAKDKSYIINKNYLDSTKGYSESPCFLQIDSRRWSTIHNAMMINDKNCKKKIRDIRKNYKNAVLVKTNIVNSIIEAEHATKINEHQYLYDESCNTDIYQNQNNYISLEDKQEYEAVANNLSTKDLEDDELDTFLFGQIDSDLTPIDFDYFDEEVKEANTEDKTISFEKKQEFKLESIEVNKQDKIPLKKLKTEEESIFKINYYHDDLQLNYAASELDKINEEYNNFAKMLLSMLPRLKEDLDKANKILSNEDRLIIDIQHYFEIYKLDSQQQLQLSQALIQSRQRRRKAKDIIKNISAVVHLFANDYVTGVSQISKTTYTNNKGYSELTNNLRENKSYMPSVRSLEEILSHTHKI